MSRPDVSVIIPAYNAAHWLQDAVESVQAQTFRDWELIIVNDGSTDNTLEVARDFAAPRTRVIDQANAGVSAARNAGLAAAQGTYICFMDADDAMLPNNLEVKIAVLKKEQVDWVFGDLAVCDADLKPTGEVLVGTDDNVLKVLLLNNAVAVPTSCSNVVAHRRCFEQGVAMDLRLSNAADQDYTMQLASRFNYRHVPGVFNLYRNLPGSMSKDIQGYQDDHLRLFRKAREAGHLRPASFRRRCMANVYWAIGGSWWKDAGKPMRAIPYFLRAFFNSPSVIIRPLCKRFPFLRQLQD